MKNWEQNLETHIQSYILNKMSDADAEEFEEFFLARPDIAESIDLALMIRRGLKATDEHNPDLLLVKPESKRVSIMEVVRGWFVYPVPAFAVVLLTSIAALPLMTVTESTNSEV